MEANGLTTQAAAPVAPRANTPIDWSSKDNQRLLKATVARNTTDVEFAMFRELCIATKLNPFRREIWCIVTNPDEPGRRQVQIMTGIGGYFQIANSHDAFDGLEWSWEHDDKGKLISATAKAWRKDRKFPSVGTALLSEFGKSYGNWKTAPQHMLLKCAKAIALREAFPQELGGTYTEEEMPLEYSLDYRVGEGLGPVSTHFNDKDIEGTYLNFRLKHGSEEGKALADITNGIHLEKHFHKYLEQYSAAQQEALALRIDELKKQFRADRQVENANGGKRPAVKAEAPLEADYTVEDSELIEGGE